MSTKSIRDVMPNVVHQAAKQHETIQWLQREWGRLVGKDLARHTRPMSVRRGTLYVHADEPGASFLLSLEQPRLLAKLRACAKGSIEELVIRPGDV